MGLPRRAAFCVFAMVMLCLARALLAQEARGAANAADDPSVRELFDELKKTPPYDRSSKVAAIVSRAEESPAVVSVVIEELAGYRQGADTSYIANCIMVLGRLKAREGTDVLIEAVSSPSGQIKYLAAWALGETWENAGESAPELPRINAALLAAMHAAHYAGDSVGLYGPCAALVRINSIGTEAPAKLDAGELRETIGAWAIRNPGKLPSLEDQPWELLVDVLLSGQSPSESGRARGILIREKPLEAIDTITSYLRKGKSELPEELWVELGKVLTGITEVEFPSVEGLSRSELVDAWLKSWTASLMERTAEPYRQYAWWEFEQALLQLKADPTDLSAARMRRSREVVLYMLNSFGEIPAQAFKEASELLNDALELKRGLLEGMDALNKAEKPHEKLKFISAMRDAVESRVWIQEGQTLVIDQSAMALKKEVAMQFVPRLAEFARKESNRPVLRGLSRLLTTVTGMRCRFDQPSDEARNRAVDEWLEEIEK